MTTSEPAIKANEREAQRLFERGVAAARGGQRRVAAGLLARAVQLNPRHESGWLWLSGTLDEPNEIAFCLRSVLTINPDNQRARQGLIWLEQRGRVDPVVATPAPVVVSAASELVAASEPAESSWLLRATEGIKAARPLDAQAVLEHELQAHTQNDSWWVNFRRVRRDMSRVRLVLWTVPILLLVLTLILNYSLRSAVQRNEQLAREAAVAAMRTPEPELLIRETQQEIVLSELPPSDDARVLAYLSALEPPRARLRTAIDEYRVATSRPGGSSTTHAASARRLRDAIEQSYASINALTPPTALTQPHAYYLSGLETEMSALDDMLAFYGSFSVEVANRATIRMSEADRYIQRANRGFINRLGELAVSRTAAQTMR
jgi:hypothetical protein